MLWPSISTPADLDRTVALLFQKHQVFKCGALVSTLKFAGVNGDRDAEIVDLLHILVYSSCARASKNLDVLVHFHLLGLM